jgi:acyl-CoA thioester hydrolase
VWAEHHDHVQPDWLDDNGHMNLAYYVLVFDRGTDAWLELAGLGAAYRASAKRSVFAVETHTIYRQEVRLGAPLQVRTRLAAAAAGKRIHLLHEMSSHGTEVAMQEVMFLYVDLATRRSIPLAGIEADRVAALAPPVNVALPDWVGRRIGAGR